MRCREIDVDVFEKESESLRERNGPFSNERTGQAVWAAAAFPAETAKFELSSADPRTDRAEVPPVEPAMPAPEVAVLPGC